MGWSTQGVWSRQNEEGKIENYYEWDSGNDTSDYVESRCEGYQCPQVGKQLTIVYGTSSACFFRGYVKDVTSEEEAIEVLSEYNYMPVQEGKYGGLTYFESKDIVDTLLEKGVFFFTTKGKLNEEFMQNHFGWQPERVNKTASLFTYEGNWEISLHPELQIIYGDVNTALKAYKEGEFLLWQTKEGLKFYGLWRDSSSDSRNTKYSYNTVIDNMKIPRIEGENMSSNELFDLAVENFYEDAVTYTDERGVHNWKLLDQRGYFNRKKEYRFSKIVQIEGKLVKKDFNFLNYQDLGIKMTQQYVGWKDGRDEPLKYTEVYNEEIHTPKVKKWDSELSEYKLYFCGELVQQTIL